MDQKTSPYDLRDPARAPEVAHSYSPIPVTRDSEGLQVGQQYASGKEAVSDQQSWGEDEKAARYGEAATQQPAKWWRRKRWIIAAVLLLVIVVAVAVGAGVGASLSGSDGDERAVQGGEVQEQGQSSSER